MEAHLDIVSDCIVLSFIVGLGDIGSLNVPEVKYKSGNLGTVDVQYWCFYFMSYRRESDYTGCLRVVFVKCGLQ